MITSISIYRMAINYPLCKGDKVIWVRWPAGSLSREFRRAEVIGHSAQRIRILVEDGRKRSVKSSHLTLEKEIELGVQ